MVEYGKAQWHHDIWIVTAARFHFKLFVEFAMVLGHMAEETELPMEVSVSDFALPCQVHT